MSACLINTCPSVPPDHLRSCTGVLERTHGSALCAAPVLHHRSGLLLAQLWVALPEEERSSVLARLAAAEGREKLPAVQALAAQLSARLRQLS